MTANLIIAILVGSLASITMNLGKGIQKMKVHVFKTGKQMLKTPENRRDLLIWALGMTLTAGAGLLFTMSLKMTEKPSIVSSLNGIGLIALAFFSAIVLKEKVGGREWMAVLLIIIGTGIVQFFNEAAEQEQFFTLKTLLVTVGICAAIFFVIAAVTLLVNRGQAFIFSAIAGTFLGLMFIFFKAAGVSSGEGSSFLSTLLTPYFIIGFFMGNGAFVMTNVAFLYGSGIVIVPTVNSFLIVTPMIMEIFIFKVMLDPIQYIGALVIIAGVVILTTGSGHGIETPEPAGETTAA